MIIKWKKTLENAVEPEYKSRGAAGADLCVAAFIVNGHLLPPDKVDRYTLEPGDIIMIDTGIALEIPIGYEGQIRARSGLGSKGITLANAVGTWDADYRSSGKIPLINLSKDPFTIWVGDRVAQLVIAEVEHATFCLVQQLTETVRGENGFGSTGI